MTLASPSPYGGARRLAEDGNPVGVNPAEVERDAELGPGVIYERVIDVEEDHSLQSGLSRGWHSPQAPGDSRASRRARYPDLAA